MISHTINPHYVDPTPCFVLYYADYLLLTSMLMLFNFYHSFLQVGNFEFLSKLEEGIDTSSTATPMAV